MYSQKTIMIPKSQWPEGVDIKAGLKLGDKVYFYDHIVTIEEEYQSISIDHASAIRISSDGELFKQIVESEAHTYASVNKTMSCSHQWITTQGFLKTYIDCSICGAKREDLS